MDPRDGIPTRIIPSIRGSPADDSGTSLQDIRTALETACTLLALVAKAMTCPPTQLEVTKARLGNGAQTVNGSEESFSIFDSNHLSLGGAPIGAFADRGPDHIPSYTTQSAAEPTDNRKQRASIPVPYRVVLNSSEATLGTIQLPIYESILLSVGSFYEVKPLGLV